MSALVTMIPLSPGLPRRIAAAAASSFAAVAARTARAPAWAWPLGTAIAAWPSLWWSFRRFGDGSDDPFGIVAWCALAFALFVGRARFNRSPRTGRLALAVLASLIASIASLPDLVRACIATWAIVLALAAIVDDDEPIVPYAGFALLALPLLSSLQFYAGFPLRVVTAEASRWLLTVGGAVVVRDGTALTVDGHLVLVDAPCSGVQMAWIGYFTACFAAWLFRSADRATLRRLPLVGLSVLAGNIVRNTILVALEAHGAVSTATHQAIGLAVVACVLVAIVALFASCRDRVRVLRRVRVESRMRFFAPAERRSDAGLLVAACALAISALLPVAASRASPSIGHPSAEWPTGLDGEALVPIALSDVEQRFANDFPGSIARFANGSRLVVLRDVDRPTRRLHPAVDCYRGLGYTIVGERLERAADGRLSRCFDARRVGQGLRVCERIVDADGHADTDVSSWYWNALLGRSHGPWRASTIAEATGDGS